MDIVARRILNSQRLCRRLLDRPRRNLIEKVAYHLNWWWFTRAARSRFVAHLEPDTRIGDGLRLPHKWNGIVIAGQASIGNNVTIFHHVTIGINSHGDGPVIGDNVLIGAGANIIGRCIIGDGARIGAGVVLTNVTIPPGAVIVNKSAYDLTNKRYIYPQD